MYRPRCIQYVGANTQIHKHRQSNAHTHIIKYYTPTVRGDYAAA